MITIKISYEIKDQKGPVPAESTLVVENDDVWGRGNPALLADNVQAALIEAVAVAASSLSPHIVYRREEFVREAMKRLTEVLEAAPGNDNPLYDDGEDDEDD